MRSAIVTLLVNKFNSSNISYCHWKSTDHLGASFQAETDLDILISQQSFKKVENILNDIGFMRTRTPDVRTYPCVEDYICFDSTLNKWVHLHAHFQIPCGDRWSKGYHIPFEEHLLTHRVFNDSYAINTIDPVSEYMIFLHRMFMKWRFPTIKKSFREENEALLEILNKKNKEFSSLQESPLYNDALRKIYKEIFHREYSSITLWDLCKFKWYNKKYRRKSPIRFWFDIVFRYSARVYIELNRRILRNTSFGRRALINGGVSIAFVGMDGSGKSSMILECKKKFSEQLNVDSVFFGTGRSGAGLLRKVIFSIYDFVYRDEKIKFNPSLSISPQDKRKKTNKPSLAKLMWIALCLRDRKIQLKKFSRSIANGRLVLIDRLPQMHFSGFADSPKLSEHISSSGLTGYIARKEKSLFEEFSQVKINKIIWLDVDPSVSLLRKPNELSLELAQQYRDVLTLLCERHFSNVEQLDANLEFEVVRELIWKAVWNTIK